MSYGYSAKNNTFYVLERTSSYESAGTWPDDVVDVSDEMFIEYSGDRPLGKVRAAGDCGLPVWVDENKDDITTDADLIRLAETKKSLLMAFADNSIRPLERAKQLGIATDDELSLLAEWERYSVFLMRVDTSNAPDIDWPKVPQ